MVKSRSTSSAWAVSITMVTALIPGVARADDPGDFTKGTWVVDAYGSYTGSFFGEKAQIGAGTLGVGYYLFDHIALNAEFSGYHNSQHGPDSDIVAADVLLRHHIIQSGRFSLFLDAGAGISYADHRTPYYGTYYNYILETGVGATFQLHDNLHLIGGVRYLHLSNAELEGPEHNPSINGVQGYVGLLLKF